MVTALIPPSKNRRQKSGAVQKQKVAFLIFSLKNNARAGLLCILRVWLIDT
jgi:hypothetical protein